jgi:phosphoglycolate phosphatase
MTTKEKPVFIFDFDGTIADTFAYYLSCMNVLADSFHFRKIHNEEIETFRGMPIHQIIDTMNIPKSKIPLIVWQARKLLKKGIHHILPVRGIKPALQALQDMEVGLGIITSNSVKNVKVFLEQNDLEVFDFIFSSMQLWEKSRTLKRVISGQKLFNHQVFYIGDETRDIEAAHKADIKGVAVTWGYNSVQALQKSNPDFIINEPSMLIGLVR